MTLPLQQKRKTKIQPQSDDHRYRTGCRWIIRWRNVERVSGATNNKGSRTFHERNIIKATDYALMVMDSRGTRRVTIELVDAQGNRLIGTTLMHGTFRKSSRPIRIADSMYGESFGSFTELA